MTDLGCALANGEHCYATVSVACRHCLLFFFFFCQVNHVTTTYEI